MQNFQKSRFFELLMKVGSNGGAHKISFLDFKENLIKVGTKDFPGSQNACLKVSLALSEHT